MSGWLVINEFLKSDKFQEIYNWLLVASKNQGVDLLLKTNAELIMDLNFNEHQGKPEQRKKTEADFILFWDKDVKLALRLEQMGYRVFNSSDAIRICDDKAMTHLVLMNSGIRMPRTIIAPMTFDTIGYSNDNFLKEVSLKLGYPMIIKESFGSFGMQVYKINTFQELRDKVAELGARSILFQEYIANSTGRDIRLQVVGKEVIAAMYRYSENGDFRANVSIGGKMKRYIPTKEQCELALRACEIIGLDFAGVDILFGNNDEPMICEVNSNAHFKNIYDCTGINVADAIIRHIHKAI